MTQYLEAKAGRITPEMIIVAGQEFLEPELIRTEIAAGRLVIPANKIHLAKKLQPIGIGSALRTKINANLGNSALTSDSQCEIAKVQYAINYGADTVMDLSTGSEIDLLRQRIIDEVTVPVGTVPLYQVCEQLDDILDMTPQNFLDAVEHQAKQGVDYMTIHAGLLQQHLPLTEHRLAGIVSRGGSLTAKWMVAHKRENPFYEHFDDLCEIMKEYDVCWSIGDGLRPGCLHDASDAAQFGELDVMGGLAVRAWEIGCQVMIEGPGHIPLDQIEMNIKRQIEVCYGAPFYVLGPVVCDIAPGYDHITSAIGATLAAFYGAAMLCYVTPKEHLGLPNMEDVRQGVIAYKIAAHAADVARKRPHAREHDDAMSRARFAFDWEEQFRLSLDSERAREYYNESRKNVVAKGNACQNPNSETGEPEKYCTMCGPKFCAMKTTQELRQLQQKK
ncbi:MAG: phosphomethylpyrimidine synthase ThiC [Planctomycetaceae bacterium]|jgi:phosphomethylpyrimidine synthase|nr:phosphomethylpyrimidine synthase ThiC [Planctomycetaceae bacterium]